MWLLCRQDGPSTFANLAAALNTRSTTTTSRRKEYAVVAQGGQQRATTINLKGLLPVDDNGHFATRRQFRFGEQEQPDQQENDGQEEYNGQYNGTRTSDGEQISKS